VSIRIVDARHLLCPLPVIRTQDAVAECHPGDELQVLSTDPGVTHDIPAWCRVHGHRVVEIRQDDRDIVISIVVGNTETDT